MLNVIDLFAGVGGLSYGFQQTGCNIILANEIDPDIAYSYTKNHINTKMINSDISRMDIESIFTEYKDEVDIVIGGPPCQGFSQKGSRKSIDDKRNFLFKYFYNVVEFLKPKYFLMENVPNILTTENGLFINEIENLFKGTGYEINYKILNAANFGVPQHRRRAFILGKYKSSPPKLPEGNNNFVTAEEAIGDLEYLSSGEGKDKMDYLHEPKSDYQRLMRTGSMELFNHKATNHSKEVIGKLKIIPEGMGKEVLPQELLTKSIYSGTWSRIIRDEPTVTITTRFDTPSSGRFTHYRLNRCITVREAARLQSFPDTFIFYGTKTSQMKQVGNAVPPLLGKVIAETIIKDAIDK